VSVLAFSPDGTTLAAAGDGRAVVLWDLRTGKRAHRLEGHGNRPIHSVRFSPDGRRLVTAGADRTARVWQVRTGAELAVFRGHAGPVEAAHFLDPDTVMTAGDGTLRTWSVPPPPAVSVPLSEPDPPGGRLGKWFGTAPARHHKPVTALAFDPDGRSVVTGSADGTVRRWDPATGRQVAQLPTAPRGAVRGLQFGPGGVVYVGSEAGSGPADPATDPATRLSLVCRWDPATNRAGRLLKGQRASVDHLELSPDGRRLLVQRGNGELVYRPDFRPPLDLGVQHPTKHGDPVTVWDPATGERLWAGPPADDDQQRPRPRFSPDGQAVVSVTERADELALYDAATGARLRALAMPRSDRGVMTPQGYRGSSWAEVLFSPDGRVVVGHQIGEPDVWFWDPATGAALGSFPVPDRSYLWQLRMAFSPDSRRLALVGDRAVQVVDVPTRTGAQVLSGHEARVTALAFSPDGTRLLTGSADGTAALWDVAAGRLRTVYRGHPGGVDLVAYSPDGTRVATASPAEPLARVWPVDVVPGFEKLKPRELTAGERMRYELPAAGRE
jgi:WD40 repeat protein